MCWKNLMNAGITLAIATLLAVPSTATAGARTKLEGFQEVPSISTDAAGRFWAKLERGEEAIAFKLSYAGIETPVRFAHIHFAERHVNGAIVVWLCDNTGNSPIVVDPCPQEAGTVEGVITPGDVSGAPAQGIDAGEFHELIEAINAGAAYINVHSEAFPGGEIRGQLRGKMRDRDGDDHRKRHHADDD
jgi:hypothetical protein